jgi:hypothetical protein
MRKTLWLIAAAALGLVATLFLIKPFNNRYQIVQLIKPGNDYEMESNLFGKDDPRSRITIMLDSYTGKTWELKMLPEKNFDPHNPITEPLWFYIPYHDTVKPVKGEATRTPN